MRYVNVFLWLILFSCMTVFGMLLWGVGAGTALAGSLDSPAAPTSAGSAMYTLEDIYNRLNAGTAGAKRTGAFTEPSSGPVAGGHTLNDVMGKAPYVDNATGAGVADVTSGKKFWGLTSSGWGIKTGTGGGGSGCSAGVPKTWQKTSYLAGDDGALQKGVAWPNPRFTDNGNGAVKDNLTGLTWLKNANCYGQRGWADAVTVCRNLASGGCGLSDGSVAGSWRLANIRELMSLLDFGQYSLIPANAPFASRQTLNYWSSTTYPKDGGSAYAMGFNKGQVGFMGKGNANYVWPVRGGQ